MKGTLDFDLSPYVDVWLDLTLPSGFVGKDKVSHEGVVELDGEASEVRIEQL